MMHKMMVHAIEEAKIALSQGEVPIGAVVAQRDQIIGRGHNCKEITNDPTAHAEIMAIRQAAETLGSWRLNECTLYVTAEPCPMCMGALIQARISTLVYGASEPSYGAVESTVSLGDHPQLPKNMTIYPGICERECSALLEAFFKKKRAEREIL